MATMRRLLAAGVAAAGAAATSVRAAAPAGVPVSVPLTDAGGDYHFYASALYPSFSAHCPYEVAIARAYALTDIHESVAGLPTSAISLNGSACADGGAVLASSAALSGDEPAAELADLRQALATSDPKGTLALLEQTLGAPLTVLLVTKSFGCGAGGELPKDTVGFLFEPPRPFPLAVGVSVTPPDRVLYMPTASSVVCQLTTARFAADKTPPPSLTSGGGAPNNQQAGNTAGDGDASPAVVSSTPTPTADGDGCFPASARVALADGSSKRMDAVAAGDVLAVTHTAASAVFGWSHRAAARMATFVAIHAAHSAEPLLLSPTHYLYVNGALAAASTVAVGDTLTTAAGVPTAVTAVGRVEADGLYAPHTLHGELVVNGVRVSSYTQAVHPDVAHALLAPARAAYRWGVAEPLGGLLYEGVEGTLGRLARFLPRGW